MCMCGCVGVCVGMMATVECAYVEGIFAEKICWWDERLILFVDSMKLIKFTLLPYQGALGLWEYIWD